MALLTLRVRGAVAPFSVPNATDFMLRVALVHEVALPGQRPVRFTPEVPDVLRYTSGLRTTQSMMSDARARRIIEFARICYEQKTAAPLNCYSFLGYAAGWTDDVHARVSLTGHGSPTPKNGLRPGGLYAITTENGDALHGMVGWTLTHNLSVLGAEMPLAITANDPHIRSFGGERILGFAD